MRVFIPNYHFYWNDCFPERKGGTAIADGKGIPHNLVELPPPCFNRSHRDLIPIGNSEMLLATVYKSPGHIWNDADIIELLSFRRSRCWQEI
jgi:hypothetical protein